MAGKVESALPDRARRKGKGPGREPAKTPTGASKEHNDQSSTQTTAESTSSYPPEGGAQGSWRVLYGYRVHPAADVFPLLEPGNLAKLGADIKAQGLREPIEYYEDAGGEQVLLDGINRITAVANTEGLGDPRELSAECVAHEFPDGSFDRPGFSPQAFVIAKNIRRRHLSKQQQAELIVAVQAAARAASGKPRKVCEVSRGGRGKVDTEKAEAVAEGKKAGIGKRTMEQALAKAKGKTPKPKKAKTTTPVAMAESPAITPLCSRANATSAWSMAIRSAATASSSIIPFRQYAARTAMTMSCPYVRPSSIATALRRRRFTISSASTTRSEDEES
jgi:hypothetical protein